MLDSEGTLASPSTILPPRCGGCNRSRGREACLFLAEQQIKRPGTANVRTGAAAVVEDRRVGTAGVFESIAEDGEASSIESAGGQGSLVVGRLCQRDHGRGSPGRVERDGEERVTEDVAKQVALPLALFSLRDAECPVRCVLRLQRLAIRQRR